MASGHVNRTKRPNTWLHRPACGREESPCQPGAVHTWHFATLSHAMNLRPLLRANRTWPRNGRLAARSWATQPGDAARPFGRPHTAGKHTSPRRKQPQLGDAKRNPGRYDLRRQSARRLAFAMMLIRLALDHRTSEKNCSNSPRNSSGGPSLPSLMTGVAM
jgi:hypothetical protein